MRNSPDPLHPPIAMIWFIIYMGLQARPAVEIWVAVENDYGSLFYA